MRNPLFSPRRSRLSPERILVSQTPDISTTEKSSDCRSHILFAAFEVSTFLLCILLGLVACQPDRRPERGEGTGPSSQHRPTTDSPSAGTSAAVEKHPKPVASTRNRAPGPSYLIVIGSWKLEGENSLQTIPQELETRHPQSVRMASGFPRPANREEKSALRPSYGALLAGICDDKTAALAAMHALESEGVDAYIKESPKQLSSTCPLPSERWLLGHELVLAAESDAPDSTERVKNLLDRGAPPDHGSGSATPLSRAVYNNDLPVARLLLTRGARVNIVGRAPQEESILELAIRSPYGDPLEMVQLLVAHGADVNATTEGAESDPGSSVQIAAVRQCRPRVLEFLYAKGTKRQPVSDEEICRDRHPPKAPDTDRAEILRLLGKLSG